MYCYEVVPDFVKAFKYLRKDGKDEVGVNYMEAAFDLEAKRGEFFIEFEKQVNDTDVVECFEAQGAKGAQAITFQKDNSVSAANALASVLTLQDKTGSKASRGSSDLLAKARAKQVEDAKQEELRNREFNEKESAAIQKSLEDVNGNVKGVMDSVQSHGVELVSHGAKLESHGAKLDSQGVVMEDIKHGFCNVIPDYQLENKNLKEALKHQTRLCDVQEAKTAAQTTVVNKQKVEILSLRAREEAQLKREEAYLKRIKELEDSLEVSKSIENVKQIEAFLKEELAFARSERAASRQSAMANDEAEIIKEEEERAAKRPRV